jgi:hypothetical protein
LRPTSAQSQAEERAGSFPVGDGVAQHDGDEHVASQARRHYHGSWIPQFVPGLGGRGGISVAEQYLAHAIGSNVTRSYLRTSMLERRRPVLASWASFVCDETGDNVIELRRAGA